MACMFYFFVMYIQNASHFFFTMMPLHESQTFSESD